MAADVHVRVEESDFDVGAEIEAAARGGAADVGAVASFVGYCRSESGRLAALELQHYAGMAEAEISRVVADALDRWPAIAAIRVIHRHGLIRPGERIVFVAASSSHRAEAFEAAEFLMDYLKTSAPFWKREHLADGSIGGWVEAKQTDEAAVDRWSRTSRSLGS